MSRVVRIELDGLSIVPLDDMHYVRADGDLLTAFFADQQISKEMPNAVAVAVAESFQTFLLNDEPLLVIG